MKLIHTDGPGRPIPYAHAARKLWKTKKGLQACKPDSVPGRKPGGYHLSCSGIAAGVLLRTRGCARCRTWREQRSLHPPIPHCSTQGLPAIIVANKSRGLLPHIFTLTPSLHDRRGMAGRLFSVALSVAPGTLLCSVNRGPQPLAGALLCAVRTFLCEKISQR